MPFFPLSSPSHQPPSSMTTFLITSPTLMVSSSGCSAVYGNSTSTSTGSSVDQINIK
ncbi:hypothetical protein DPMN_053809 [Dreissena polymorpha]|uniref:Uncharacterized protein n=1 Tax=Dreissena polymorpha TaxID=45954 RepID=A0A9D4CM25_DREPO|nr:hypothetical protein DPMN_053809 [Dreissena polymorpha]